MLGMDRTAGRASRWPRRQPPPSVCARLECRNRCHVRLGCVVFQILVEKWTKNVFPKIETGIAVEFKAAKRTAIANFLTVVPRPKNEKHFVVIRVLRLDRLVDCRR